MYGKELNDGDKVEFVEEESKTGIVAAQIKLLLSATAVVKTKTTLLRGFLLR
jgi:hypothetical protein